MAIYYARANGNVNGTIWATTQSGTASNLFSSFNNTDVLMANGFAITLNVNTTVAEIRNDTTGGATNGGSYTINDGITLTANIFAGGATTLTYNGLSPNQASIVGNITGGPSIAVSNNSTGILNIIGSILVGSSSTNIRTVQNGAGTINLTGNVTGGGGVGTSGISHLGVGTINITGNVVGGVHSTSYGANNEGIGTINIIGTATGGAIGAGANNNSTGTLTVTRAKGNGFGNGSVGLGSAVGVSSSQNGLTRVYEIEYGDLGQSPTSGPVFLFPASSNVALFYRSGTTKKTLVDAASSSGLLPSSSDVRSGITYNAGTNTGTMAVPAAASVALGVSVDNTTGTAILTSGNIGDIWNYPVSGISVSNSIGERLKNCSTVATMGQQLAAALNNVQ